MSTGVHFSDVVRVGDDVLTACWKQTDWKHAEAKLAALQQELTQATIDHDRERQKELENEIVEDFEIRCIAVRDIASRNSGPGVDKVRWRTAADCMHAATALQVDGFRASPMRQIDVVAKGSGKVRHFGLPTYHDKAMARLFTFVLAPITEATAERKSFAFRAGRSAHDAHEFLVKAFTGKNAPSYAVVTDVESYYASIRHEWVMKHVPMNKDVLREFISNGHLFAGKLFPRGDEGLSEANALSPYIANFMLDGLQTYIYTRMHGKDATIEDFDDGNMIRFADDIVVAVRTYSQGDRVLSYIRDFLADRGLRISPTKSKIVPIEEGFTFLSRTYRKINGVFYSYPSKDNVERFIARLNDTVTHWKYSQRKLIDRLNNMLSGWANYHRFCDAGEAFRQVDLALQTSLLSAAIKKHPSWNIDEIIERYFAKEDDRQIYTLTDDRSVRVKKLADVPLVRHRRVRCNVNAYAEPDYLEDRAHSREINNVSGPYRAIWRRQRGVCHHCKNPILKDEPKRLVPIDITEPESLDNAAYVHARCALSELEVFYTDDTLTSFIPYDTMSVLEGIARMRDPKTTYAALPENWQYNPLKSFFAREERTTFTLTFAEIEEILGYELPPTARKHKAFWYRHDDSHISVSQAWETEDYKMFDMRFDQEKMRFKRVHPDYMRAYLPPEITEQRIPNDAAFELNQFAESLVKKYRLSLMPKEQTKRHRRKKEEEPNE